MFAAFVCVFSLSAFSATVIGTPSGIVVEKFEFVGEHTAFSEEQLAQVTMPFTKEGRRRAKDREEITFAELLQAEAAVTSLYTDAGFINSGAVIEAGQNLQKQGGVVRIRIIEGGLEDIRIKGARRLDPNYVRSRLAIASEPPLNRDRLLTALQLLRLDPLIENLSAELSAGWRPNLSILEVDLEEADAFHLELFANNGRNPSVGTIRRGIRLEQANLLGYGDGLRGEYTNTDGSRDVSLRYRIPVNPRNGAVVVAGGVTSTEVTEPPFDRIEITGDTNYFELGLSQPLFQTATQEFILGLTASRQESQSELLGEKIPISAGADDKGRTRISAIRFSQAWTQRSRKEVLAVYSQFSLGLDAFNATINERPPDSRFFSWRGQGQYVRLLAPEKLLLVRADLQLADKALVPLEQFAIGGWGSVRGYRQDALLTDNGFFASSELQWPLKRVDRVNGVFSVVPFIDVGVGWNDSDNSIPDPDPNYLIGIGLGLQWKMADRFTARLDWGIPLTDIDSGDRTLQEKGLYFTVNFKAF